MGKPNAAGIVGWNRRVHQGDGYARILEVYYGAGGTIKAYSDAGMVGNDVEDLRGELEGALRAFDKPVLTDADLATKHPPAAPGRG